MKLYFHLFLMEMALIGGGGSTRLEFLFVKDYKSPTGYKSRVFGQWIQTPRANAHELQIEPDCTN